MKKNAKILIWVISVFLVLPSLVIGWDWWSAEPPGPVAGEMTTMEGVFYLVNDVVTWFFWFLLAFAIIMFIIAGINFLTAAGDPEKVKKARNYIIYGVIGVAVGLLSKTFIVLVGTMVGLFIPWF